MASDERVKELTDKLAEGVRAVFASERYAEYLCAMNKFPNYSARNVLLILMQDPGASLVASYGTWKQFGRHVRRGELGIRIIAPRMGRRKTEQEDQDEDDKEKVAYFRPVTVFDIRQTEGKELPTPCIDELTGSVENYSLMYERLLSISPVPVEFKELFDSKKGYFSPSTQRIVLQPGMSEMQTIKTLVHEIVHAKLHDPLLVPDSEGKSRAKKEVEAESVAYVVCQRFGLDVSDYSFGYVASWSKDKELSELKDSLETIHKTSVEIIHAIQPPEPKLEKPKQKNKNKNKSKSR